VLFSWKILQLKITCDLRVNHVLLVSFNVIAVVIAEY